MNKKIKEMEQLLHETLIKNKKGYKGMSKEVKEEKQRIEDKISELKAEKAEITAQRKLISQKTNSRTEKAKEVIMASSFYSNKGGK